MGRGQHAYDLSRGIAAAVDEDDGDSLAKLIHRGFDAVDSVLGVDSRNGRAPKSGKASGNSPTSVQAAPAADASRMLGSAYKIVPFTSAEGVSVFGVTDGTEDGTVMCRTREMAERVLKGIA